MAQHQRPRAGERGQPRADNPTTGVRLVAPLGTIPEPRRDLPRERADPEAVEVSALRRLLIELRPFGPGPDSDPAEAPLQGRGASMAPRVGRAAAWEVTAPAGAFQRLPPALDAGVCRRIATVPDERDRASLEHLRVAGHLGGGYGGAAVRLAMVVAPSERRAEWAAGGTSGHDRARLWGARSIERACVAWELST